MRELVVNHAGRFPLLWLGAVVTGLGALVIAAGLPLGAVVCTQLALQLALAFSIAVGVPDRFGGAVAVAMWPGSPHPARAHT